MQATSTRCRVIIVAPNGARFQFEEADYSTALMGVEVQKDLNQACGSFTLHFAPVRQPDGRYWHEVVPRRSVVYIAMERDGDPSLPEVNPTIMIGFTTHHGLQESWREAHPHRQVTISGREMSTILLDAKLVYSQALASHPEVGTLTMTGPGLGLQEMALAWSNNLARRAENPMDTLERILDYFLFVGGKSVVTQDMPTLQQPVIQLDMPATRLDKVLKKNREQWSLFDDRARVFIPFNTSDAGSIWNYLHLYIDRAFQEFFTRIERGLCYIHFRGKPFRHDRTSSGTRFKTSEQEPTLQTLTVDPDTILQRSSEADTDNVYNYFVVFPLGLSDPWLDPNIRYKIMPQYIGTVDHPSFVGRYGIRDMQVESPYLAPFDTPTTPTAAHMPLPLTPPPAGQATYATMANQVAAAQGIPAEQRPWFVALIKQESYFNPNAKGTSGEKGLGQLMPALIAHFGIMDPFDPLQSLTGAARYWQELRNDPFIASNPAYIVAAYNAGPNAVRDAQGIPASAAEHTRRVMSYVPEFQSMAGMTPVVVPPVAPGAEPASGTRLEDTPVVQTAMQWASILQSWYDMGGELFGGTLVVRGHPAWNIGHRLLCHDERGTWEAYIEGVSHQYDMRTGHYLTTLRYTRGWYLSDAQAQQLRRDGQTTITEATGGPPLVSPLTGEPQGPGLGDVQVILHVGSILPQQEAISTERPR